MPAEIADGVQITVSIGFSTTAGSGTVPINSTLASITYTDVSTYVRSVQIKRGRSSELDDFTTGNCQVILSNEDRTFDPENTVGAYYGKITPGRPIRIQATAPGGSAETIFQGYVDQWDQQYTNPSDAVAVVTASDAFKVLNLLTLPSYWEYQVREDGPPTCWFRFDDGNSPSNPFDSVSGKSLATWRWIATDANVGSVADAAVTGDSAGTLVMNDTSVSASLLGKKYIEFPASLWNFSASDYASKTVECWIQSTPDTPTGQSAVFFRPGNEFTISLQFVSFLRIYGVMVAQWGTAAGVNLATEITSTVNVDDGKPHHVVMRWNFATSVAQLWVDGIQATTTTGFSTSKPVQTNTTVGKAFTVSADATKNPPVGFIGIIDELAFYGNTTLSAAQIAAHYAIGKGNYLSGNTASQRLDSLLTMADWMSDGETFSTATSTVQGIDTQNDTLLSALKECEKADQGRLFCDRSGLVKFISHDSMATTSTFNTSQRTFGDGTGELPYLDLEFTFNDQLIFNRSIVSRFEGATAVVNDTTSQGQYFIRTDFQSGLINDTDQAMTDIANVRLATYKQPQLRIDQMRFSPRRLTSMYSATITDDIGTRITVKRRPQGVGSVISKELIVEGISHDIGISSWETTYNLSPAPLAFFILNSSTFGVLGTNLLGY